MTLGDVARSTSPVERDDDAAWLVARHKVAAASHRLLLGVTDLCWRGNSARPGPSGASAALGSVRVGMRRSYDDLALLGPREAVGAHDPGVHVVAVPVINGPPTQHVPDGG